MCQYTYKTHFPGALTELTFVHCVYCTRLNTQGSGLHLSNVLRHTNKHCPTFVLSPAGWRSCSCALMSTVVWVPPAWPVPPCACSTSLTTASRTGPKSASLAPCFPAWTLWLWPTTTWHPFRTARTSCHVSFPIYAASTYTTQVSGAQWCVLTTLWSKIMWENFSGSDIQLFLSPLSESISDDFITADKISTSQHVIVSWKLCVICSVLQQILHHASFYLRKCLYFGTT